MDDANLSDGFNGNKRLKFFSGPTSAMVQLQAAPQLEAPVPFVDLLERKTLRVLTINDCYQENLPLRTINPLKASFEENAWKAEQIMGKSKLIALDQNYLKADDYCEKADGVYAVGKGREEFIVGGRVRIRAQIKKYWCEDEEPEVAFRCSLSNETWEKDLELVVALSEYKQLYFLAKQQFPQLRVTNRYKDNLDHYLSDVFASSSSSWREERRVMRTGWFKIDGQLEYVIGDDVFYAGFAFPDVSKTDKVEAFCRGFEFLAVGNYKCGVTLAFIFAHLAYTNYFAEQADHKFQNILFYRGMTNSYKTSLLELLSNVFETARDRRKVTFGSSKAALYHVLSYMQDQTVLLDDFACSEKSKKKEDTALFENVIRAVGDSVIPVVMDKGCEKIKNRKLRTAVFVTGEDDPPLSQSSMVRCITVPAEGQDCNLEMLTYFQENPAIMRTYFAEYIAFLKEEEQNVVSIIGNGLRQYRQEYASLFSTPRIKDAAVNLTIETDIIRRFARWCGVGDAKIDADMARFKQLILETLLNNQEEKATLAPHVMFVYALMQSIGTKPKTDLAESEDLYSENEAGFIGFREEKTDTIWLRHEEADLLAQQYWEQQGKAYTVTPEKLRKLLFEKDISVGGANESSKKVEYLKRAKKGQRKRMLVLKNSKIKEILDGIHNQ